jgi:hypothetical protein
MRRPVGCHLFLAGNGMERIRRLIIIAKAGVAATLSVTVCIRAHPVWCAFFGSITNQEFAWAGLIGSSVPNAVTGLRLPVAQTEG